MDIGAENRPRRTPPGTSQPSLLSQVRLRRFTPRADTPANRVPRSANLGETPADPNRLLGPSTATERLLAIYSSMKALRM